MPKEVEFVCTNPQLGSPVTPEKQGSLMRSLSSVPGLHVYRQDWGHLIDYESVGTLSLAKRDVNDLLKQGYRVQPNGHLLSPRNQEQ